MQTEALRAPDYPCRETGLWAKAHPDDRGTRPCEPTHYTNGAHTTTFPKQVFVQLPAKYPKSWWAAATPYWY